ncbi:MAG: ATP-binding protein [Candidatus Liptonbacteria bacterium]|nr:ATP-binding protein [Candidatus Liptonbacteria bacterium]
MIYISATGNRNYEPIFGNRLLLSTSEQAHIFEKFIRASNAKLYKTDGTGLGLYIAERATRRLGGKIWFESDEGKGSTFYAELPFVAKAEPEPAKAGQEERSRLPNGDNTLK